MNNATPRKPQRSSRGKSPSAPPRRRTDLPNTGGPVSARSVARDALVLIERDQSYANLRLRPLLEASGLDERDRRFATELTYGTLRQQRALDFAVGRFLSSPPNPVGMALLRLGAYQLLCTEVPDHAAVSETVAISPKSLRGLVNAVLRKVASSHIEWPSIGVELSYPDWIVDLLSADLGHDQAHASLRAMNLAPGVDTRADGYIQNSASQRVARMCDAQPGDVIFDLCAAPGGKATVFAGNAALVVAGDIHSHRMALIASNAATLGQRDVMLVQLDARQPPLREQSADLVLVDAPCSGLGVLHRRADARWRVKPQDLIQLSRLQFELLSAAADLVKPGGRLVYSVCTLSRCETIDVADRFSNDRPDFTSRFAPDDPWIRHGSGAVLLPNSDGQDGMAMFCWVRDDESTG